MAVNAQNIKLQTDGTTLATLAESFGKVFENLEKTTLSAILKNTDLSGTPDAGVMNVKRMANATAQAYGTARAARKGTGVLSNNIPIAIDDDKEWLEEVEQKDVALYGIDSLIPKRAANIERAVRRYFERKFFNTAVLAGTVHTITGSAIEDKLEEIIQKVETVSNDFVDGVSRDSIAVVLRPSIYGQARNKIDAYPTSALNTSIAEIGVFHGVMIASSVYLPATVDYLVMTYGSGTGAVAQPITYDTYGPEVIQLSKATAFGAFTNAGHKAVAPDLIFFAGTMGSVTATSADGAAGETTKTVMTVTSTKKDAANDFYYLTGATAVAAPAYGDAVGSTWTKLVLTDGAQKITTGTATKIRVAEADASGRIIAVSAEITIEYVGS